MSIIKNVRTIVVLAVVVGVGFFVLNTQAFAQSCGIEVTKSATPADDTQFVYNIVFGEIVFDVPVQGFPPFNHFGTGVPVGDSLSITELTTPGWELVDLECNAEGGVDFSIEGPTVTIECLDDSGEISCVYTNVLVQSQVPTLSEWGLITMAGLLGMFGFMFARRRKFTA